MIRNQPAEAFREYLGMVLPGAGPTLGIFFIPESLTFRGSYNSRATINSWEAALLAILYHLKITSHFHVVVRQFDQVWLSARLHVVPDGI